MRRRRGRLGGLPAGLEAAVEHALRAQTAEGGFVIVDVFRLAPDGGFPFDPEPGEGVEYSLLELRSTPGAVDVLDAEQETAAGGVRRLIGGQGRIGMTQVERPGGGRGEAGDEAASGDIRLQEGSFGDVQTRRISSSIKRSSPPKASITGLNWAKPTISATP